MSVRILIDRTGVRWTVSEVAPTPLTEETRERRAHDRSATKPPKAKLLATRPLALSALRFERLHETRRLTPAPAGWHALADDELEDLLHLATLDRSR